MTARALKALLGALPDDVLELELYFPTDGHPAPIQMVLIDPPDNINGLPPAITLCDSRCGEGNPEIIAKMTDRR